MVGRPLVVRAARAIVVLVHGALVVFLVTRIIVSMIAPASSANVDPGGSLFTETQGDALFLVGLAMFAFAVLRFATRRGWLGILVLDVPLAVVGFLNITDNWARRNSGQQVLLGLALLLGFAALAAMTAIGRPGTRWTARRVAAGPIIGNPSSADAFRRVETRTRLLRIVAVLANLPAALWLAWLAMIYLTDPNSIIRTDLDGFSTVLLLTFLPMVVFMATVAAAGRFASGLLASDALPFVVTSWLGLAELLAWPPGGREDVVILATYVGVALSLLVAIIALWQLNRYARVAEEARAVRVGQASPA